MMGTKQSGIRLAFRWFAFLCFFCSIFVYFIFQIRFLVSLPFPGGLLNLMLGEYQKQYAPLKKQAGRRTESSSVLIWPEVNSDMRQVIDVCCYECLYL